MSASAAHEAFWRVIERLRASGVRLERGRIMNAACVRSEGSFVAMFDERHGGLIVRLTEPRARELISRGLARPFAPAGRPFRAWVAVASRDVRRWRALVLEGVEVAARE